MVLVYFSWFCFALDKDRASCVLGVAAGKVSVKDGTVESPDNDGELATVGVLPLLYVLEICCCLKSSLQSSETLFDFIKLIPFVDFRSVLEFIANSSPVFIGVASDVCLFKEHCGA